MEDVGKELIGVLQFLLPGFFSAWVYYGLTPHPLPSQFERVVQALIFTFFIQIFVQITKFTCIFLGHHVLYPWGHWNKYSILFSSALWGFILGAIFSNYANNDRFHALMRKWRITSETSYPSQWYGTFCNNSDPVILHLKDKCRLYGFPNEWPSQPGIGHFVLSNIIWLDEKNKQTPAPSVTKMLIPAESVSLVEFVVPDWKDPNDKKTLCSLLSCKK